MYGADLYVMPDHYGWRRSDLRPRDIDRVIQRVIARVLYGPGMAKPQEAKVLVLAGLLRRGHVASQAPRAWKADDILGRAGLQIQTIHENTGDRGGDIG